MRRLRDRKTGEVYGWNPQMALLPVMEEFDDGEADPDAKARDEQAKVKELLAARDRQRRGVLDPVLDVNGDGTAAGDPSPQQVRESRIAAGLDPETGAPVGHGFDLAAYEKALADRMETVPDYLALRADPGITPEIAARVSSAMDPEDAPKYRAPVEGAGGVVGKKALKGKVEEVEPRPTRGKRVQQPVGVVAEGEVNRPELDTTAAVGLD